MNAEQRATAMNAAVAFMVEHEAGGFAMTVLDQGVLVKSYWNGVFLFDGQANRQTLLAGKSLASVRQNV